MKKRLIITSALMTCLLGASLATGTYAWYQATAGSLDYKIATKGNISTKENSYELGKFEITAVLGDVSTEVDLTDETGHTYYYLPDKNTKVDAGVATTPQGESTVGITIKYVGEDNLSDAQIKALWETSGEDSITVTLKASNNAKVGKKDSSSFIAASGNNSVTFTFETNEITFESKIYTSTMQNWCYGVAGQDSVEEKVSNGTVVATPAKTE